MNQRVARASCLLFRKGLKLSQVLCNTECKTKPKKKPQNYTYTFAKNIKILVYLGTVWRRDMDTTAPNLSCDLFCLPKTAPSNTSLPKVKKKFPLANERRESKLIVNLQNRTGCYIVGATHKRWKQTRYAYQQLRRYLPTLQKML